MNARNLGWVVAIDGNEDTETAFAVDGIFVYRRETDLSQAKPVPRYFRAPHREVLADDSAFDDGRVWEACTATGEPLHPTWLVHVSLEHLAIVNAPDAEAAKVKAVSRLGLPHALLRKVQATATPST